MSLKPYRKGLVVGKFSPLHHGHMLVIQSAIAACDELIVISYSNPDFAGCEPGVRERWIAALFPQVRLLVLDGAIVDLPANDAPDDEHRQFCGWLCQAMLGTTVDAVFTSESYGDGFAQALSRYFGAPVRHVLVDIDRKAIPISGTAIRADPFRQRRFLDPLVYASFVRRVCVLGGESGGKTTFAAALADALRTVWVAEYGRDLWIARDGALVYEDMLDIGTVQVEREVRATQQARRWLVCDTSPLTTAYYSADLFGQVAPELAALAGREYAHAFVCERDFPFVQDGTRRDADFGARQHLWYLASLRERRLPFTVLRGSVPERVAQALAVLSRY